MNKAAFLLICFLTCVESQNTTTSWLESSNSILRLWDKYFGSYEFGRSNKTVQTGPVKTAATPAPLTSPATSTTTTAARMTLNNFSNNEISNDSLNKNATRKSWRTQLHNYFRQIFQPNEPANIEDNENSLSVPKEQSSSWLSPFFSSKNTSSDQLEKLAKNETKTESNHKITAKDVPRTTTPLHEPPPEPIIEYDEYLPGSTLSMLRCLPSISLESCVNHCVETLPPPTATDGFDISSELMPPSKNRSFRMPWTAALKTRPTDMVERDRKKQSLKGGAAGGSASPEARIILDGKQWQELQLCLLLICVPDYMISPIPGCLANNGLIVTEQTPKDKQTGTLDQYNPAKLDFYRGIGYFTLGRILRNLFPESAAAGVLSAFSSAVFNAIVFLVTTLALALLPTVVYYGLWPLLRRKLLNYAGKEQELKCSGVTRFLKTSVKSSPECLDTVN